MKDILPFLDGCDALVSGQTPPEIISKAITLIEDPTYWCGEHTACIRTYHETSDGIPYLLDTCCKVSDPRATCLSVEGAVARACNDLGITPPVLQRRLDQWTLDYLNDEGVTVYGQVADIWCEVSIGWFGEKYGHQEVLYLLNYIYEKVSASSR
jgi:hypothetical protein